MRIIDIHAHIYQKVAGITHGLPMQSEKYGRVMIGNEKVQFLPPSFENSQSSAETLLAYMDWCGIEKALLMPNPYYGYHNDYFIETVKKYPNRFRGVALVNLLGGEAAARELQNIYDNTPLFGFKIETYSTFQCAPQRHMGEPVFAPVFDCCNQNHQPVFIHLFTWQDVMDLEALIKKYPWITFVICHMGADACFGKAAHEEAFDQILSLVKNNRNVYIDTSTVPVYFEDEYPFDNSVAIIEKGYREVGPEKMMWASDYPGMLNHATMQQLINLVLTRCKNIPQLHKNLIMGENAQRLFFINS